MEPLVEKYAESQDRRVYVRFNVPLDHDYLASILFVQL